MERLLARLERRIGFLAIPNLASLIVGGMVIVFVLAHVRPDVIELLTLDIAQVRHGQAWRLVSYVFLPEDDRPIFLLLSLYWLWLIGSNLENEWGAFKFTLFYLVGMLGTTVAAAISGAPLGNFWLNVSLGLAFATVFPDFEFLLFFVVPMKNKWMGWMLALFIVFKLATGTMTARAEIVASLANYLLFFAGHLRDLLKSRNLQTRQAARRSSFRPPPDVAPSQSRACAICGKREEDGADIRVCTCEKCGGKPRELCLEHARNH